MKHYASLIGPLLGCYYELPTEDPLKNRIAMQTSRLKNLWHHIYTEDEVNHQIEMFGGIKLPKLPLDYDSTTVNLAANHWRYIITDTIDGMLKGTNDPTKACDLAKSEDWFVYDAEEGKWLTAGYSETGSDTVEPTEIEEIHPA